MSLITALAKPSDPWWTRQIRNFHRGTVAMVGTSKSTTKSTSELPQSSPVMRTAPALQSLAKLLSVTQRPDQEILQVPGKRLWPAGLPVEIPRHLLHLGPWAYGCGVSTGGLRAFSSSARLCATPPGCTCGEQNVTPGGQSTKCPVHDSGRGTWTLSGIVFVFVLWSGLGSDSNALVYHCQLCCRAFRRPVCVWCCFCCMRVVVIRVVASGSVCLSIDQHEKVHKTCF